MRESQTDSLQGKPEFNEFHGVCIIDQVKYTSFDFSNGQHDHVEVDLTFHPRLMNGNELNHRIYIYPKRRDPKTGKDKADTTWMLIEWFKKTDTDFDLEGVCCSCHSRIRFAYSKIKADKGQVECSHCHMKQSVKGPKETSLNGPYSFYYDEAHLVGKPVYLVVLKNSLGFLRVFSFCHADANPEEIETTGIEARAQQTREQIYSRQKAMQKEAAAKVSGENANPVDRGTDDDIPF